MNVLLQTQIPDATLFRRGKVRDVYLADADRLVIVATDRISSFDVVLPTAIPDKGRLLTQISNFWFEQTSHIVPNHLLETEISGYPAPFSGTPAIDRRSVLVRRCERIDIECVARG